MGNARPVECNDYGTDDSNSHCDDNDDTHVHDGIFYASDLTDPGASHDVSYQTFDIV